MKARGIALDGTLLPPALVGVMVLLDRSGSMSSVRQPMQKAFDDFVAEQRQLSVDGMWVTLHQFDSQGYDEVYNRKPLGEVGPLVLAPRGGTPLIDSLCRFVKGARSIVDDPNDQTERLLLVVVSDGQDTGPNAETWATAKELVQGIESTDCEVIWMGTDASVLEAKEHIPSMAVAGASMSWTADESGADYLSKGFGAAATLMRSGGEAKMGVASYTASSGTYDPKQDAAWQAQWAKAKAAVDAAKVKIDAAADKK